MSSYRACRASRSASRAARYSCGGHNSGSSTMARRRASNAGSPASRRASSKLVNTLASRAASARHCAGSRTAWPTFRPMSHKVAKNCSSARSRVGSGAFTSASKSTSEYGNNRPRPKPPTANSVVSATSPRQAVHTCATTRSTDSPRRRASALASTPSRNAVASARSTSPSNCRKARRASVETPERGTATGRRGRDGKATDAGVGTMVRRDSINARRLARSNDSASRLSLRYQASGQAVRIS